MAMSGGVDSGTSALLLKNAGYRVVGATMVLFDRPENRDLDDARTLAANLDIPHLTLDYVDGFKSKVQDHFCAEYLAGRTPNPCVDCNRHFKMAALQQVRQEQGLDYVATGHYVRRVFNPETGLFELHRAADLSKDQSYVLYHLSQDTLAHMLFPLGDFTKPQVRAIADEAHLPVARKGESQDICFIPDGDHTGFIRRHTGRDFEPGEIVDLAGDKLGTHQGLACYTIGQRKGVGVAAGHPIFVVEKRADTNQLVMGPLEALEIGEVTANQVSTISGSRFPGRDQAIRVEAKLNYRQTPAPGVAFCDDNGLLHVVFDQPVRACAPGQALVVYQGDNVLGGGTILQGR